MHHHRLVLSAYIVKGYKGFLCDSGMESISKELIPLTCGSPMTLPNLVPNLC